MVLSNRRLPCRGPSQQVFHRFRTARIHTIRGFYTAIRVSTSQIIRLSRFHSRTFSVRTSRFEL